MKEQIVKEWFERASRDLKVAEFLINEQKYSDAVLFHIHQAVEKYLKGFLISKGWQLKKIHDLETLITEAVDFGVEFQKYLDFARKLTAFYYEERYPPGPITSCSKEEMIEMLKTAREVINTLKQEAR